jgi:hypothetical protein
MQGGIGYVKGVFIFRHRKSNQVSFCLPYYVFTKCPFAAFFLGAVSIRFPSFEMPKFGKFGRYAYDKR